MREKVALSYLITFVQFNTNLFLYFAFSTDLGVEFEFGGVGLVRALVCGLLVCGFSKRVSLQVLRLKLLVCGLVISFLYLSSGLHVIGVYMYICIRVCDL